MIEGSFSSSGNGGSKSMLRHSFSCVEFRHQACNQPGGKAESESERGCHSAENSGLEKGESIFYDFIKVVTFFYMYSLK